MFRGTFTQYMYSDIAVEYKYYIIKVLYYIKDYLKYSETRKYIY